MPLFPPSIALRWSWDVVAIPCCVGHAGSSPRDQFVQLPPVFCARHRAVYGAAPSTDPCLWPGSTMVVPSATQVPFLPGSDVMDWCSIWMHAAQMAKFVLNRDTEGRGGVACPPDVFIRPSCHAVSSFQPMSAPMSGVRCGYLKLMCCTQL